MSLNTMKTYYINFTAKNQVQRDIGDLVTIITNTNHNKFLGLTIENAMTWKRHIDEVTKKLTTACYMIRNIKPVVSMKILKSIYYSYFHSVMTYGLIFWGNSSHAERVFKLQKRAIRLIKGCDLRESCREHFRDMNILPLRSQYMYSLIMFVINNKEIFNINKDCYGKDTRQNMNIHMYQVNLAKYRNGVYHMAARIYNGLPNTIKIISNNANKFKASLKEFLFVNSFYTLEEYFNR